MYRLLARAIAALHIAYVVFVVFGALLVLHWPALRWAHFLAILWALVTLTMDLGCVLTRWEKSLYRRGGLEPYPEGFLLHHVVRADISPAASRQFHVLLGVGALLFNVAMYALIFG